MALRRTDLRNVAIIAHVDHGKTTLVDCLLRQSGQFRDSQLTGERILDSGDLERERGITILAKNIALQHEGVKINVIDTPGHADFGGEVERVLRMADGALLLLDAAEGPMPQTRFVLRKALECGLKPIVVVNKIDRPDARSQDVVAEALELFLDLGADEQVADFPYVFASAKEGFATSDPDVPGDSMQPLLEMLLEHVPGPEVDVDQPLQMLISQIDYSEYVGRIAIGRIQAGKISSGQPLVIMQEDGQTEGKVGQLFVFDKLGRTEAESAQAGDIAAVTGLEKIEIGDTLCDLSKPVALPRLRVDEPTLRMIFQINSSPLAGREGKFLTTRHLRDRLMRELEKNVALRVEQVPDSESFAVSGRGILHLSVLIETMRREGYELSVGKPQVILREQNGSKQEPFETLSIEVPHEYLGPVMEIIGNRRGQNTDMSTRGDLTLLSFIIPSRGLIGIRTRLLNATKGTAVIHHRFESYRAIEADLPGRANGVLVSMVAGKAVGFALDGLQERAEMFVAPGDEVYEGMVVGENSRSGDMDVNPTKEKKLTNIRAAGSDRNILLKPPRILSLEAALEYISDDELVEITPHSLRLRKTLLSQNARKRATRQLAAT
ncbi:MAG: translational GTPase TypA [Planctomycetaceae bacterium TMED10]|nr:MAG: translational GTPase TypA [Planctomycetaceae bacterium TMED10]